MKWNAFLPWALKRCQAMANLFVAGCEKGAKLIQSTQDVIEELNFSADKKDIRSRPVYQLPENLSENQRAVCKLLKSLDLNLEEIIEKTDIEYSELCSILLELELKGILNQLPGKKYQLVR